MKRRFSGHVASIIIPTVWPNTTNKTSKVFYARLLTIPTTGGIPRVAAPVGQTARVVTHLQSQLRKNSPCFETTHCTANTTTFRAKARVLANGENPHCGPQSMRRASTYQMRVCDERLQPH
eukprot:1929023-Pyramimonas_sp.AAC.1